MASRAAGVGLAIAMQLLAGAGTPAEPAPPAADTAVLTVTLSGLHSDRGLARVSLFPVAAAKQFPDDKRGIPGRSAPIVGGKAAVVFTGVPYGTYAAAALHDEDEDGAMNTGVFGIPKEGFGFSNDARPKLLGPPPFADARFVVSAERQTLGIVMQYM